MEEELDRRMEIDIAYLQRNIAPDDIYLFAQNTLLASYLLAHELLRIVGRDGFGDLPRITRRCLENVAYFKHQQESGEDANIDMNTNGLI